MKRCGYCKRFGFNLIRITVTTRGEAVDTYSHKTCIYKWRKIAEIESPKNLLSDENPTEIAQHKEWLERLDERELAIQRRRNERRVGAARCETCGAPIYARSRQCNHCNMTRIWRTRREQSNSRMA